jgi:protein SCO1/2
MMTRRTLLASLIFAPGVVALSSPRAFGETTSPGRGPRADYFPNVVLRTHENKTVRFYDDLIKGKIVLINFMYAKCADGLCPRQTPNLVLVQRALGDRVGRDIFMYSITLKPEEDTPAVLRAYANAYGVKSGWLFLTGKPDDVEILRRKLGFVSSKPARDRNKNSHLGVVLYGNEALDRWAACPALTDPGEIARYVLWMEPKTARAKG